MSSREDINGAETDPPGFRDEVSVCVKLFNIFNVVQGVINIICMSKLGP